MYCLLIGPKQLTYIPSLLLESADETWRCAQSDEDSLLYSPHTPPQVILLFPGEQSLRLLDELFAAPPLPAPWLIACGFSDTRCDLTIEGDGISQLPSQLRACNAAGQLPLLGQAQLDSLSTLAAIQLHALQIRPRLGAWRFLPRMLAMTTVHPPLLDHLSAALYPLCGAECGLNGPAVERSLRIAVESAWSTSPLIVLERFFGQAIDPNKGKPTNREFLCQMAEHLRLAAMRCDMER